MILDCLDPVATLEDSGKLDLHLVLGREDVSRQHACRQHPEQRAVRDERPAGTKAFEPSIVIGFAIDVDVDAVVSERVGKDP